MSIAGSSFTEGTAYPITPTSSASRSSERSRTRDNPASACTMSGTLTRLWPCGQASIPKWCPSAWATPTSASRLMSTHTPYRPWRKRPPPRSRRCSCRGSGMPLLPGSTIYVMRSNGLPEPYQIGDHVNRGLMASRILSPALITRDESFGTGNLSLAYLRKGIP